ncbi:MAG: hypothetical protein ACRDHZ_16925, partial [Ktedonobacteraceae bacterium]
MSGVNHALHQFDPAKLAATEKEWRRQLQAHKKDILATEYERILGWTGKRIDYGKAASENFVYGIFENGSGHAVALVDMVYQKAAKKWLKLMDIFLCPAVDLSFATQNVDIQQLTSIYAAAVIGTIQLTSTAHPTKVTKLYGRSGTLLAFLKGVGTYIANNSNVP